MRACHRCGVEVALERIGVRDVCGKCRAYLHCCRNCEFYERGAHNDCREPNAELVAEKEDGNFCEYFHFSSARHAESTHPSNDARAKLERLFKK